MQQHTIEPVLIDHLPHINSISNSLTNSGDVSFFTSIDQFLCIEPRHSDGAVGVPGPDPALEGRRLDLQMQRSITSETRDES